MISETWFVNSRQHYQVPNYAFFVLNRKDKHKNAPSGSGGVGLLVHQRILNNYQIVEIVNSFEGQLAIVMKHRNIDYSICIASLYLPPDNSKYGQDPEGFYEALTQLVYEQNHVDEMILGGDYNGRIGDAIDYIPDVDDIQPRTPLDHTSNAHGECLINFLKDTGYAVINSRVTSEFDNFTSISTKGTAVVDYICCRNENMSNVLECKVLSMNDVLNEVRSSLPAFQPETMSDHSIILVSLKSGEYLLSELSGDSPNEENENGENSKTWEQVGQPKPARFKINGVKPDFLKSPERLNELTGLIDEMLEMKLTQERLDSWYEEFVKVYHNVYPPQTLVGDPTPIQQILYNEGS